MSVTPTQEAVASNAVRRVSSRPVFGLPTSLHLATKEIIRNKGRFALIALVVALITLLVLFTAGLAEGLGLGNREYIEKLNADLLIYSDKSELFVSGSRISQARIRDLRQIDGVQAVGAVAFTNVALVFKDASKAPVKVALAGVLAGQPGEPPVVQGRSLDFKRGMEAVLDQSAAIKSGLRPGDLMQVRSIVGGKEKIYELTVAGIAESNQYGLQSTVFVPHLTWEKIKPRVIDVNTSTPGDPPVTFNVALVRLNNPADITTMAALITQTINESKDLTRESDGILAVQKRTAYENTPGYSAQQSTLTLQRVFTLLIGLLVVGSFFRIQALQKIAQVGVLKAIGTPSSTIVISALFQIFVVNALGVFLGALLTYGLALGIPQGTVPIRFDGASIATAIVLLLLIGPLGGLVSVQVLLKAEPLKALGLAS